MLEINMISAVIMFPMFLSGSFFNQALSICINCLLQNWSKQILITEYIKLIFIFVDYIAKQFNWSLWFCGFKYFLFYFFVTDYIGFKIVFYFVCYYDYNVFVVTDMH